MSLSMLLYPPPTQEGLKEWALHHYQHHLAIMGALKSTRGVESTLYRIWPMQLADADWAFQHQSQHSEMTGFLGLQSSDLSVVDYKNPREFDAWLFQHFTEHQVAAQRLGVPI